MSELSKQTRLEDLITRCRKTIDLGTADAGIYNEWGYALLGLAKPQEAIVQFEQAIKKKPDYLFAHYNWGIALARLGKHEESIAKYKEAIAIDPDYADAYNAWGNALLELGKPREALTQFEQAIKKKPDYLFPHYGWGLALGRLGKHEEAIVKYKEAIAIDTDYADAYSQWGRALLDLNRPQEAIEQFEQAIKRTPDHLLAYYNWGLALGQLGKHEEAIAKFEKAISIDSNFADSYNQLGKALVDSKRPQEAIAQFQQAIQKKPDHLLARYNWGIALARLGKPEEAIAKYKEAIDIDPKFADAYHAWGSALLDLGKPQEAIAQFEQAIQKKPGHLSARYNWGIALARLGKQEEAIAKYKEAIRLNNNYASAYNAWGKVLLDLGQPREAVGKFEEAIQKEKNHLYAHYNWGLALGRLGKPEEAIAKYQEAIGIDPNYADAYNAWGNALLDFGRPQEAIEKYRQAIDLAKEPHVYAHRNLGIALARLGKQEGAIAKYKEAVGLNGNYADAYNDWGNALLDLGRSAEAIEQYKQAIAAYERATNKQGEYAYAYYNWGRAVGRTGGAINGDELEETLSGDSGKMAAELYRGLGSELVEQKRYDEAVNWYGRAVEKQPENVAALFAWGVALSNLQRHQEALDRYGEAARYDPYHAYSLNNRADILRLQGRFPESMEEWQKAKTAYEHVSRTYGETSRQADFHYYYGAMLHEIFGELDEAEERLLDGLRRDPSHEGCLHQLTMLYLEKKDIFATGFWRRLAHDDVLAEDRVRFYWQAQEYYRKAKTILSAGRLGGQPEARNLQLLVKLHFAMEDSSAAEEAVRELEKLEPDSSATLSFRGRLWLQKERFKKAVECFEAAACRDPDFLVSQANLAEAYRKAGQLDKAEAIFSKNLSVSWRHVESHFGLGNVYIEMGEAGEADLFEQAISHLTSGINLLKDGSCSKRLNKKVLAEALYLRGYAKVKCHEAPKTHRDFRYLREARRDFKSCYAEYDPDYHKARRAEEKLNTRFKGFQPQTKMEKWGPFLVFLLSLLVFVAAQALFFLPLFHLWEIKSPLEFPNYCLLTFAALLFIIAGLYLPQILKLKVGVIQLEKNSIDQISSGPITIEPLVRSSTGSSSGRSQSSI